MSIRTTCTCSTRSWPTRRHERAFAFVDDGERRAALARHGFTQPGEPYALPCAGRPRAARAAAASGRVSLPDGPRPDDVPERVAIHQDVWAPSRLTEASYARVRAQWPYRESLDCVIEAPGGRFAAYCLCWLDDTHQRRRVRARRRAGGVPPSRPRRRRLHLRAQTSPRRTWPAGDRLLRDRIRRARCTSRSAFGSTPRSSTTAGPSRNIGV